MGYYLSKMLSYVYSGFANEPARIIILGLHGAGKTTILYKLKLNKTVQTVPTIGFNTETVTVNENISFTMVDVGGGDKIWPLYRHYLPGSNGIIFVVDSSDKESLEEARENLFGLLDSSVDIRLDMEVISVPLVVMANKQDLPGACTTAELEEALGLRKMRSRKWCIQACCATTGDGLWESMNQLAIMIKECKECKS